MNIRKKISTLVIAAALVCGLSFATNAIAQNNNGNDQNYNQYAQNYTTQMTPEQKTSLQQILKDYSDTAAQIEEAINAKRGELMAQLDSTAPDKGKITSLSRELGDLRGQLLTARVDMKARLAEAGIPAYHTPGERHAWRQGYRGCPVFNDCPAFNGWNGGWHGGWGHHNGGYQGNWYPMGPMMMEPGMGW